MSARARTELPAPEPVAIADRNGPDDIGPTLQHEDDITRYETTHASGRSSPDGDLR